MCDQLRAAYRTPAQSTSFLVWCRCATACEARGGRTGRFALGLDGASCCVSLLDTGAQPVALSQRRFHGPTSPRHIVIACAVCSVCDEALQRGHTWKRSHTAAIVPMHTTPRGTVASAAALSWSRNALHPAGRPLSADAWCPEPCCLGCLPGAPSLGQARRRLPWLAKRQSTRQALITGKGQRRVQLRSFMTCGMRIASDIAMLRGLVFRTDRCRRRLVCEAQSPGAPPTKALAHEPPGEPQEATRGAHGGHNCIITRAARGSALGPQLRYHNGQQGQDYRGIIPQQLAEVCMLQTGACPRPKSTIHWVDEQGKEWTGTLGARRFHDDKVWDVGLGREIPRGWLRT